MSDTNKLKEGLNQFENPEVLKVPTDPLKNEEEDIHVKLSNTILRENGSVIVNQDDTTNPECVNDLVINVVNDVIEEVTEKVHNNTENLNESIVEDKNNDDEIKSVHSKIEEKAEEKENEPKEQIDENVEEEQMIEEPPPDPAAPLNLSESTEEIKPPFELRPDQLAEVEQLWELYQDYTPVYTDIKGYITQKELVYLLKCLLLMTYTEEQLQELISYCVKPPDPNGHIRYDQFLKMVTIRQREFPIEEEIRAALQVLDPGKTNQVEREYLKDVLKNYGNKMPEKQLNNLIKEVDMSNDGKIGIEDVVGTMGIDLNKEDLLMLMASLNPPEENVSEEI